VSDKKIHKAVLFDFDGVIINSRNVQEKALETAYREILGEGKIPYEGFFLLSGQSLENIFNALGLPQEMVEIYQRYSRNNIDRIKIHDGITAVLKYLKENHLFCALCTGKERIRTIEILKYLDLEKYFDIVVCSDDVSVPKPDPESIMHIMKELKVSNDNCIMIGDGINDVRCAHKAGVSSIAVTWGEVEEKFLKLENPTWMVHTIEELFFTLKDWII